MLACRTIAWEGWGRHPGRGRAWQWCQTLAVKREDPADKCWYVFHGKRKVLWYTMSRNIQVWKVYWSFNNTTYLQDLQWVPYYTDITESYNECFLYIHSCDKSYQNWTVCTWTSNHTWRFFNVITRPFVLDQKKKKKHVVQRPSDHSKDISLSRAASYCALYCKLKNPL